MERSSGTTAAYWYAWWVFSKQLQKVLIVVKGNYSLCQIDGVGNPRKNLTGGVLASKMDGTIQYSSLSLSVCVCVCCV